MDKETIIAEILPTADANGGLPLGRHRLAKETGIKHTDWGQYWENLSDAHRELGLPTNELQKLIPDRELLSRFADLTRERRSFPTDRALQFKKRNDDQFPSIGTFRRFRKQLGGKHAFVKKLRDYCRETGGYDDVVRICDEYLLRIPSRLNGDEELHTEASAKEPVIGYVYLQRSKKTRRYKLGKSNAVGRREYELRIQLPEPVQTVHEIRTDDPSGIEAYWKRRFKDKRIVNDGIKSGWFNLDLDDVRAFKRRQGFM